MSKDLFFFFSGVKDRPSSTGGLVVQVRWREEGESEMRRTGKVGVEDRVSQVDET